MERDWIPPEPHGIERIGADEDLIERKVGRSSFEGEFGERAEGESGDRQAPDEAGPR